MGTSCEKEGPSFPRDADSACPDPRAVAVGNCLGGRACNRVADSCCRRILHRLAACLGQARERCCNQVSRILKGYALAVVFGLAFGVTMGMSEHANRFFGGLFKAIRQIPMIAWVPLLVMWFGIGEESKVAVIFIAAFFQILLNTISGIQRTDKKLVEVGKMYQLSKWRLFREIYLSSALPSIFVGLKLGLSVSWMAVVGAEMIAASSGIGFRINDARALLDYPVVFSGMIAIAVAGVLMDLILSAIAKGCMPWERGEKHAS